MKRIWKRYCSRLLSLCLAVVLCCALCLPAGAASGGKTTAIYVVFDNSGSMYIGGKMAWSQATYAMEMFASMLDYDRGDVMKVYTMHNVTTDGTQSPSKDSVISVSSAEDIQKIHNMYTENASGTPFTQVINAANDLSGVKADEKWLVVLTDGAFDSDVPSGGAQKTLADYAQQKGINVQYLAMGSSATPLTGDTQNGFYADKAATSADVVSKLAEICNRIFRRASIEGYVSGDTLNFDIPISKIIVFAQGESVSVDGLQQVGGSAVSKVSNYSVSYSTSGGAGGDYANKCVTDTSLKGVVAAFANSSSMPAGDYVLEVTGAKQISVYYEPDVQFGVALTDGGTVIPDGSQVEAGELTVTAGFIDQSTGQFITGSGLLGDARYTLNIGGSLVELVGTDGSPASQTVSVGVGDLSISGSVEYLAGYTGRDAKSYEVVKQMSAMDLQMEYLQQEYLLTTLEEDNQGIALRVLLDGEPLPEDVWQSMELPAVTSQANVAFRVERGSEVSSFMIYPGYAGDLPSTAVGEIPFTVSVSLDDETRSAAGTANGAVHIIDNVSTMSMSLSGPDAIQLKVLEESEGFLLTVQSDGQPLTEEQWNSFDLPVVVSEKQIDWLVKRGDEVSTYRILPRYRSGDMFQTDSGEIPFTVTMNGQILGKAATGTLQDTLEIKNDLSLLDYLKEYWLQILIWLSILLLILGYIPPFKKYLPRSLKKKPLITKKPNGLGKRTTESGAVEKSLVSTLIPYKAQTGTIRFAPIGARPSVAKLRVKSAGRSSMYVMNYKDYAGKKHISFGGISIEADAKKPIKIFAGTDCKVKTDLYTATCVPNQKA